MNDQVISIKPIHENDEIKAETPKKKRLRSSTKKENTSTQPTPSPNPAYLPSLNIQTIDNLKADDILNEVARDEELEIQRKQEEQERLRVQRLQQQIQEESIKEEQLNQGYQEIIAKSNESYVQLKRCPKCNKRLRKSFVKKEGNTTYQVFKCKRRSCDFVKRVEFVN